MSKQDCLSLWKQRIEEQKNSGMGIREWCESQKLSKQEEQIRKQQIQIENMIQALLHARKKNFGSSSEKTQTPGQIHLFMTEQELAVELLKQQKEISVKAHKKIPRKSGVASFLFHSLPDCLDYVSEIFHGNAL